MDAYRYMSTVITVMDTVRAWRPGCDAREYLEANMSMCNVRINMNAVKAGRPGCAERLYIDQRLIVHVTLLQFNQTSSQHS